MARSPAPRGGPPGWPRQRPPGGGARPPRLLLWLLAAGVSANAAEKEAAYSPAMPQHSLRSPHRMKAPAKRFPPFRTNTRPRHFAAGAYLLILPKDKQTNSEACKTLCSFESPSPARVPLLLRSFGEALSSPRKVKRGLCARSSLFTEFSAKDGIDRQSAPRGVPPRGALCQKRRYSFFTSFTLSIVVVTVCSMGAHSTLRKIAAMAMGI